MDYFPTFLELAQIQSYEGVLDGTSLVPLLKGGNLNTRPLFWHLASSYRNPPCSIIRDGDWKLIQFLLDGRVELYNLKNDLKESTNLVQEEEKITASLLTKLVQWRKNNNVPLPPASKLEY